MWKKPHPNPPPRGWSKKKAVQHCLLEPSPWGGEGGVLLLKINMGFYPYLLEFFAKNKF
jgi:hypothetical protein